MIKYDDSKNPYKTHKVDYSRIENGTVECGSDIKNVNEFNAWKEGYKQALWDTGWKRNCKETPVPTKENTPVNIKYKYFDKMEIDIGVYYNRGSQFFASRYQLWLPKSAITHWREIPEVDED